MGKSTISMASFNSKLLVYQRIEIILLFDGFHTWGYPNSWMFYFMENHKKNMDDFKAAIPFLGNLYIYIYMYILEYIIY